MTASSDHPQNPLHERYASRDMAALFTARHRFRTWRQLWLALATCQHELGLGIDADQLAALRRAQDDIDLERVAVLERETRHDVVAHLRHYAERAGEAGGVLHLGATSAFVTDNTDALILRDALDLLLRRAAGVAQALIDFAARERARPCLAYTHFQPAQLTTVGKRACLWLQDVVDDLVHLRRMRADLRCRGVQGTTGTQASYMTLFDDRHDQVVALNLRFAEHIGLPAFPITGQTYPRKQDSRLLAVFAGIAETAHKFGTDLRLLQGVGELAEPVGSAQVGSSAMAYKRNPIRAERLCGLARRLLTDSLNGPLNAGTQWLERSLDDSANRRLVLADACLTADAVLNLMAGIAEGMTVRAASTAARVERELPFMATETILMEAVRRGGDRQVLHERLREHSLAAQEAIENGDANPLVATVAADESFRLSRAEIDARLDPQRFTGRSAQQVEDFLDQVARPALADAEIVTAEAPRV
ncbi:MAG: adenylosuccinate lyase [Acidobacteriota bacterium]